MTLIPPVVGPIGTDLLGGGFFRQYTDIAPFTYRAGMTYASELEALRVWTFRTLVPFLNDNFGDLQDEWVLNVTRLTNAVDTALAAQTADNAGRLTAQAADNAQKIADALTAIAEADIPITDPGVLAVLNSPTTGTRGWLDSHYAPKTAAGYVENIPNGYLPKTLNAANGLTGWFHIEDFGAVGDGIAHDQGAIQAAIDAANARYLATGVIQRVFFPAKVYLCDVAHNNNPVYALLLKSGVELYGSAELKVAPGSYWIGTDYALLRSPADSVLTSARIRGLRFNGNRDAFNIPGGQQQASNIVLGSCVDLIIDGITSWGANGMGIMVAGSSGSRSRGVQITNNSVSSCSNLGIQASQFDGLIISGNSIEWVTGNAIDIYGEPESHTGGSTGTNFTINGNTIANCGNGIFPETVANGIIENNRMMQIGDAGIHINRINAEPNNILITGNYIDGCLAGIRGTGDCNNITVRNNHFAHFNSAGIYFGGGGSPGDSGTIAGYFVTDNTFVGNAANTPLVVFGSGLGHIVNMVILRMLTTSASAPGVVNFTSGAVNSVWDTPMGPGRG